MRYLKLIVVLNLLIGISLPAQAETIRDVVYGHKDGMGLLLGLDTSKSPAQRPAAVVAYMPPTDLKNIVGPNDNFPALNFDVAIAPNVSPVEFVSADDPPVLLIHGNADELVPITNSERIYALLQSAGVSTEFVVIAGAPHGLFTGDGGVKAAAALLGWFNKFLL